MSGLLNLFGLTQGAAQTAMGSARLAAENLMASQDPTYVKRTSSPQIDVVGGRIAGVVSGGIVRVIDEKLVVAKREQQTAVTFDGVKKEFLELLDDLNGSLENKGSMEEKLLALSQKASALTVEAGSPILRRNALESMKEFLKTVHAFTSGINSQRNSVEHNLISSIAEVNVLTEQLFNLNTEVAAAAGSHQDLSNLETQREGVIERLSKLINIQVVRADNNMFVYTASGKPLVEYKLYPLSYTSSGIIDYSAEYPGSINPINILNESGGLSDITTELVGGRIGACLEMRDKVYPQYQKSIDQFAKMFQQQVNHIHNKGTGFPPSSKLTGRMFVEDGDQDVGIGWKDDSVVRIALLDDKGKFAESGGEFHLDLNLNPGGVGGLTPAQIRDAINTHFGSEIATFSEGDHGYLSLNAPGGLRLALGSVDGSIPGETVGEVGFSEYFRLNDLLESAPDAVGRGYANSLKLCSEAASDASVFAIGRLNSSPAISLVGSIAETTAIASGDSSNLSELSQLISSSPITFPAAGVMPLQITSFLGYLTNMVNMIHLDASAAIEQHGFSEDVLNGLEQRYSMVSGVNQDEETAEVMQQKMLYQGILNTSRHLIEMINSMLDVFGGV
jgi:flagellar hook-associated protein 1